jgi:uncharacterized protein
MGDPTGQARGDVQARIETVHASSMRSINVLEELWHADARLIVPYPSEGFPRSSRASTRSWTGTDIIAQFRSSETELTGMYPAVDSDAVCVEYRPRATLVNGTEYTNENIAVFRFTDGLISAYHDYFDPRVPGRGRRARQLGSRLQRSLQAKVRVALTLCALSASWKSSGSALVPTIASRRSGHRRRAASRSSTP